MTQNGSKDFWDTGEVGDVFTKNVEQALRTAEPGFSFNFFDKEKKLFVTHVLRSLLKTTVMYAISEVSILDELIAFNEFKDVVQLATMFLVCGTLKAQLPYEKVYEVTRKEPPPRTWPYGNP
jgi:ribonucleoside-diphosphate reductase alpha chain